MTVHFGELSSDEQKLISYYRRLLSRGEDVTLRVYIRGRVAKLVIEREEARETVPLANSKRPHVY